MSFEENEKGKTFAFTTFSPFKSWLDSISEPVVLFAARTPDIQKAVRALKFLHYAHFIRVPPGALKKAGIETKGRLRWGGFLFNSAYNGDAEVYFRGFSEKLTEHMDDLWNTSVDWISASPYPNLAKFIKRYQRRVDTHVNAYPSAASPVRTALQIRTEVDRLVALALSTDAATFDRKYRSAAMKIWGNG
jgi:hypothetical protein